MNNWEKQATTKFINSLFEEEETMLKESIGLHTGIDDSQDNIMVMQSTHNAYDIDGHAILEDICDLVSKLQIDSLDIGQVQELASIQKQLRGLF
tara:strand:- start:488 stop:769 length:282 start_codon:yes stop_codon:yes gene_type:complete